MFSEMNSGMNRLGFKPQHYVQVWERLNNLANVAKITHMMHFSDADGDRFRSARY